VHPGSIVEPVWKPEELTRSDPGIQFAPDSWGIEPRDLGSEDEILELILTLALLKILAVRDLARGARHRIIARWSLHFAGARTGRFTFF